MTIYEALSAVMEDVGAVRKRERNQVQNFNFRGIDAVMNAVSPALRKHGVIVVPELRSIEYRQVEVGAKRSLMEHVTVHVAYTFYASDGTSITCSVAGAAMDSGDKGTPKAMSVAMRTALLQALCLPTDDPDPDAEAFARSGAQQPAKAPPRPRTPRPGGLSTDADGADLDTGELMVASTRGRLFALFTERGITDPQIQRDGIARVIGRPIASRSELTEAEARQVIASLERKPA